MAIQSAAGSIISIATTSGVATVDSTGFAAKTYVAIGEVTNIGDFGKNYNLIKHNPIGTRYTKKLKGSYDNGSGMAVSTAYDQSDAGQDQVRVASDSDASYAYKIVLQTGEIYYFTALCMQAMLKVGGVDNVVGMDFTLEIDSNLVIV